MALTEDDLNVIAVGVREIVGEVVGRAMDAMAQEIEALKASMQATVEVLNGNDTALLGEIRKNQGNTVAEVLTIAGESWERYLKMELAEIGVKVDKVKEKTL